MPTDASYIITNTLAGISATVQCTDGSSRLSMALLNIEIFDAKSASRSLVVLENVSPDQTVLSLKRLIAQKTKPSIPVERQQLRVTVTAKGLNDDSSLSSLNLPTIGAHLFLRDLGPQIGWRTVFLSEYAGPLFIYPLFYLQPSLFYGKSANLGTPHIAVTLGVACWTFHYLKRLYESVFVHRFSNSTMPLSNLFKNCNYYWGFAVFISYFINHPAYTPPIFGHVQMYIGLVGFVICEIGNFSIHMLLRNLRPAGTKERKIPLPNSNVMTRLFNYVSCPNYTYETLAWISFAVMTQSLPALIFATVGFLQMAQWAKGKQRNYLRQFPNYPKNRKAIVPFLI